MSPYRRRRRRRRHGLPLYESQDAKEFTQQPNVKVSTTRQNRVIFLLEFRTIRRSKKTLSGARLLTSANVTHEIIGGAAEAEAEAAMQLSGASCYRCFENRIGKGSAQQGLP